MKIRVIKLQLLVLMAFIVASCGGGSNGNGGGPGQWQGGGGGEQVTSVEVTTVTASSISDLVRSFGSIRAQDVVNVNPQVSNRITEIHVDLGDTVQQGQLMAKVYDVPYRDNLEQAQAQMRQARSAFERDSTQYERQRFLFDTNAISSSEFDDTRATFESSRAQYESARAAVTQSREDLANTEIRSPVYGVVLNRMIAEGDVASTGETAFEVANLIGYETRLFLPMDDWENIQIGLPVEMRLSNREGTAAVGNVTRISPQLNSSTGLGEVVISLTEMSSSIRQGVLVDARITLVTHENTIVIPRSAMIEQVETYIEPETNTVELRRNYSAFVAQGDSAVQRELTLGLEQGERIEVLEGLEEGDQLIITGHRSLSDGSRIRIAGQQARDQQEESIGGESSQTSGDGESGRSNQGGNQ